MLVWLYQYLLKRIAPEEYALYPVVMSVMAFLPLLTVVLTSGVGRYVVEAYAKGDERGVTQIVSTMFPLHLAAGVLILLGGGFFAWNIDHILTIAPNRVWDARIMMGLAVFSFAAGLVVAPFGVGLYVRQKFVLANLIGIGSELLRIGILFLLLFAVSTRVLWVAVAVTAAGLCHLAVNQVISRRLVPALRFRLSEIRWSRARVLTGFGFWNFVSNLADTIRTSADVIILNKLATPVDVTCFYLGSLPFQKVHEGVMLAKGPLGPAVTAMHATSQKERLRNVYLRGGRYGLWFTLLLAVPLIVFRRELFALYAPAQYAAAGTVMALLLLMFPFVYGNNMMFNLAPATAQIRPLAWRMLVTNAANLGVTLYLVGGLGLGATGSALGTFLTFSLTHPVLMLPLGLRLADVRLRQWIRQVLFPGVLPGLCALPVWIVLQVVCQPGTWLTLGACTVAGLAVYALVWLLFALRQDDRAQLHRLRLFGLRARPAIA